MKKIIKIAHLYYDLMNLYGETGNIKALKTFIERQNVEVEIHFFTVGDKIDFKSFDFYYLGAGSEENENIVLEDLKKYKNDIQSSIEAGKMFLVTGNAMELFGSKIRLKQGKPIETLGIFNYISIEENKRLVSDLCYDYGELEEGKGKKILGFKNCRSNITNNDEYRPFGFSDNIKYKNFFGMMFIGPILIRNPYFTNHILKILFENKGYSFQNITDTTEFEAYHNFIENFIVKE